MFYILKYAFLHSSRFFFFNNYFLEDIKVKKIRISSLLASIWLTFGCETSEVYKYQSCKVRRNLEYSKEEDLYDNLQIFRISIKKSTLKLFDRPWYLLKIYARPPITKNDLTDFRKITIRRFFETILNRFFNKMQIRKSLFSR